MDISDLIEAKKNKCDYFSKQISTLHEFYISDEIESPDTYIEWFDTIRHAGENDIVKIYINSPGGELFTGIQFLRVLSECVAPIVVSVEGACMSAATLIFLAADHHEISDHSIFLFHNYSSGAVGKGGEMYDRLLHERKWSESLLREVYENFLSETEILSILDGRDIWMDGREVLTRIEARTALYEKAQAKVSPEVKSAAEPKPTRHKSKSSNLPESLS